MIRFDCGEPLLYDPEIEKTAKNSKKQTKLRRKTCQQDISFEESSPTIETKAKIEQIV